MSVQAVIRQKAQSPYTEEALAYVREQFGLSDAVARLILARGYADDAEIDAFLHPEHVPLPDPFSMADMDKTVRELRAAIIAGEKICIYGDYDCDGICATAILYHALKTLGADVRTYLPLRHSEGYGLNAGRVRALHAEGVQCLVTVDNGISANAEIALAKELGLRVIVTDHHHIKGELPAADAVVCADRDGYAERVNDFCGAGVAYQLVRALDISAAEENFALPLAALATVADVVQLTRANRRIAGTALPRMGENLGLRALLRVAGAKVFDAFAAGFVLGPRINAAGRLGDANRALRLLLCEDEAEAAVIAADLDAENLRRRALEDHILTDIRARYTEEELQARNILIFSDPDWEQGVLGIAAARVCQAYARPCILLTESGDHLLSGSARSTPEVHIFELLCACGAHLTRFGGHAAAGGLTLAPGNLDAFCAAAQAYIAAQFPEGLPAPCIYYDVSLRAAECTVQLCDELDTLAPFGAGNEEPCFLLEDHSLQYPRAMGGGKHLSAYLCDGTRSLRMAAFNWGDALAEWQSYDRVNALLRIKRNEYNGRVSCEAHCVHLCPAFR
ncbi:MAG: single-stranded-DNA-specific exonuclease RecJ [Clostridiales bacterium]|nr:single-stranded-DNA-specific exonuclease RecJ [Clostridiales bacterium]